MAHADGHPTFPIAPSMVLITSACAAGVAIASIGTAAIGAPPTLREAGAAAVIVIAAGLGSFMLLNRLARHGLSVLAMGQVALSVVRVLVVIVAAVALIHLAQLNPVPMTLCVATAYLFVVVAEAVWVGRRVLHLPTEPIAPRSLS
jgi:hypothetical protein